MLYMSSDPQVFNCWTFFTLVFSYYIVRPVNRDGRVRQSAVIHCQIRLVYSKSGVTAYVRFTRATN